MSKKGKKEVQGKRTLTPDDMILLYGLFNSAVKTLVVELRKHPDQQGMFVGTPEETFAASFDDFFPDEGDEASEEPDEGATTGGTDPKSDAATE